MASRIKISAGIITAGAFLLLAQNDARGQDRSETAPPSGTDQRQEAPRTVALAPGTPITVTLEQTLDSKKLARGANVTAKTLDDVKQDGKVILPRGTKVLGKVTVSNARSKGDNDSTLALEFDRVELKGGQQLALQASIQAMAAAPVPAEGSNGMQGMNGPVATGNPGMTNRGNTPGASSGAASTVPRTNQGVTDPSAESGNPPTGSSETLQPNSRGVFGLGGLTLDESTANSEQGTLIHSAGKAVHLDGGTRLLLVTQGATTAQR